jgi:hypothetical protein
MAELSIKDGASGNVAKVDSNKRLNTATITETESDHSCDASIAERYNVNTGDLTLTNATKTSVLYIKNTGTYPIIITSLIYNLGATTSGTGDVLIEVIRNPTLGDIVTNANNVQIGTTSNANQNFGSANSMTGLFYKGASGETAFTDGAVSISTRSAANTGRIVITLGTLTISKGSSIGINYTPPTSNTSQKVQFAAAVYVRTPAVAGQ